jgi:hypothetical protein
LFELLKPRAYLDLTNLFVYKETRGSSNTPSIFLYKDLKLRNPTEQQKGRDIRRIPKYEDKLLILNPMTK